jgi:hypothetical protein
MTCPDDRSPYLVQKVVAPLLSFVVSNKSLVAVDIRFWLEELVCNESTKLGWMGDGSKQDVQHDGDLLIVNERGAIGQLIGLAAFSQKDVTLKFSSPGTLERLCQMNLHQCLYNFFSTSVPVLVENTTDSV